MKAQSKRPTDFLHRYTPQRVKFPGAVSEEKAKEFLNEYFRAYPEIQKAHERLKCQNKQQ